MKTSTYDMYDMRVSCLTREDLTILSTCDTRIYMLVKRVSRLVRFKVLEGYRDRQRQDELFKNGRTQVEYPGSMHNEKPARAVDLLPLPADWSDREPFIFLAGVMMANAALLDLSLRWGGDWNGNGIMKDNTFDDLCHFELR